MIKKYFIIGLLFILLLAVATACNAAVPAAPDDYPVYEYYTDIPGITEAEIAAVENLKEQYESFTLGMNNSTESFYKDDGSIGGYSRLFCDLLSDLFGMNFEPAIYEWNTLIDGLASYEIDFTGELTATEERLQIYFMTGTIAERSIKYFSLRDNQKPSEIQKERTLNYGFLEGATSSGYVQEVATEKFNAFYVQDNEEAVALLNSGTIDAFFEDGTAEAAFDQYGNIIATEYFPLIYTPVSFSTANPELAPIVRVLQRYLEQGGSYYLTELYNQGERDYQKHKLMLHLTEQEKEYLRILGDGWAIPIAAEYDNYPVSFYNETEQEWQGIAIDVLAEITDLTGLQFVAYNEPGTAWPDLLDALESGKVSLITELIPSQERESQFLWPDDPYCEDNFALISLAEKENIKVNQILYSSIALAKDTAYQEIFERWFPNHQNTLLYATSDECFDALESGEVDFMMGSRNQMLGMTNYSEKPGFKVNILFDNIYESSFGLNQNEIILCSIISKAQKLVDMEGISDHWTHRVFDYRAKLARTQIPYLFGLAILLVMVLVLVTILLLRHRKTGRELEILVQQRTSELEVQTQAAKQASRAKSDFLSRMSHEIRTPLNAVIGMAQVGKQIPDLPEKALDTNNKIISASNHLLAVLNDILDMAKIESGKFSLAKGPFALCPAMEEVSEIINERCKEKNITFATNLKDLPDIGVIGDKLRIKQILINLLGNAVKFTDIDGWVQFTIDIVDETPTIITLKFVVKDNGIGMTEEQTARLFTAFEQANTTIAVNYGGTGLGLAISENMVQKMGGKISVESELGRGSTFSFSLALTKTVLVEEAEIEETIPSLYGCHILLAEDVDINRLVLIELLASTGVQIDETVNGKQAIEVFQQSEPGYYDLIFMDIQMPIMDGYEATRAIRELPHPDAKTIPIIAMTANAYKEDIDKALANGMNGHIAKPIDLNLIYRTLHKYLH